MPTRSTHYDSLKVAPDAPPEVVRAAYKALAQKFHPDRNTDPKATVMMALVNDAYRVLSDPELRLKYDQSLELDLREQQAPEKPTETTRHSDPPGRPPGPGVVGETVDLEAVWKAWFGDSSRTQRPLHEDAKGPGTTRPPGSHTVDLNGTWRDLFSSSNPAGRSKRGHRK